MAFSAIRLIGFHLLMLTSSCLFAQNYEQKKEASCLCLCPAYNASTQFSDRCYDFYFAGSFTYWQSIQENMSLGIVGSITNPINVIQGSVVNLGFDFNPGFQLSAGIIFPDDQWDAGLEYTWFRGTDHVNTNLDPANDRISLYPTLVKPYVTMPSFFFGEEKWTLHMDFIDAELGRSYFVGKKLTFRPFIGLRAPFIRQKLEVNYNQSVVNPDDNLEVRGQFDSWGIGPRTGICLDWDLGRSFRLYGKGATDIAYTEYRNFKFQQQNVNSLGQVTENSRYIIEDEVSFLRSHIDLALGLGWGSYFYNNKWHFDFSADYTFQVFFGQNMLRCFVDDQSYVNIASHGDLYIQGLTATFRFDY